MSCHVSCCKQCIHCNLCYLWNQCGQRNLRKKCNCNNQCNTSHPFNLCHLLNHCDLCHFSKQITHVLSCMYCISMYCVTIPTCQRARELQIHDAEHHHRGQAHTHVRKRRQNDRRRTDRTHRVGVLLPMPSCLGIGGPGKNTHGTPVPLRRKAVGGPKQSPRDTTTTTKPRLP